MRNKEKYIGIFDSGVGGLTVVKALHEKMPKENIVYLADLKHMPYGDKTDEQIINYVLDDAKFLNTYELKAIVIACNTADSIALKSVEEAYDIPVFGVIDATAKVASKTTKNNKVGIIATTATINNNKYERLINKYNPHIQTYSQACPFLSPMIEKGKFNIDNKEMKLMLEDYLTNMINEGIDTLILGCTHYDLLKDIIKQMYPNLNIVSSSQCVIDVINSSIEHNDNNYSEQLYFATSDCNNLKNVASMFMDEIEVRSA